MYFHHNSNVHSLFLILISILFRFSFNYQGCNGSFDLVGIQLGHHGTNYLLCYLWNWSIGLYLFHFYQEVSPSFLPSHPSHSPFIPGLIFLLLSLLRYFYCYSQRLGNILSATSVIQLSTTECLETTSNPISMWIDISY